MGLAIASLAKSKSERLLRSSGVGTLAQQEALDNRLLDAAAGGRLDMVAHWIGAGADPRARDTAGLTALMTAAFAGDAPCVALLLPLSETRDLDRAGNDALALAQRARDPAAAELIRRYESASAERGEIAEESPQLPARRSRSGL